MSMRDDPQQPSTSTASERRREENLRRFDRMHPPQHRTTLLHVCTTSNRGRLLSPCRLEVHKLRHVNFPVLLKKHETYLNDLSKMSGSTFDALCNDLRFLANYKKAPPSMSDSEHAIVLFKLVANCVVFTNNQWEAQIDRRTLYDAVVAENLKNLSLNTRKSAKEDSPKLEAEPLRRNPKRGIPPTPTIAIPDSKRLKKPPKPIPEPFLPPRYTNVSPLMDEHMRKKHAMIFVIEQDTAFWHQSNALRAQLFRNNILERRKERELTDAEYYSDEVVLLPQHISFRLEHIAQITDFPLPQVEDDGYFPADRRDRQWYLYEKYNQANIECSEMFNRLRPPHGLPLARGFKRQSILPQELLHFHELGCHIHGFFDVWKEDERGWMKKDGTWISRRYLVDIYNHFMFPLYIRLEDWSEGLRMTFDKISFYNLRLMTVIRKHLDGLRSMGDALFAPYPSQLEKHIPNMQSSKVRQAYSHHIQLENLKLVDLKSLVDIRMAVNGMGEEETIKRKVRRSRKSDPQDASNPRPPKAKGRNQSASAAARVQLQKENVDKMVVTSPPSTSGPVLVAPATPGKRKSLDNPSPRRQPQQPTSATKRSHDDNPPPVLPPPIKKALLDSWDEHTHRAVEEEHVGEDDDEIPQATAAMVAPTEVWKPLEEDGLSPEEYASKILEHYGVKKGEDSEPTGGVPSNSLPLPPAPPPQPPPSSAIPPGPLADLVADMPNEQLPGPPMLPPPMPTSKARRSRKKSSFPEVMSPELEYHQPSTSNIHFNDEVLMPNGLPATPRHVMNGSNGTPGSNGVQKTNRVYSMKQAMSNSQKKAVFPVKKLAPTLNGALVNPPTILSPSPNTVIAMRNAQAAMARHGRPAEPLIMHPHQPGSIGFSKEVMAMAAAGGQIPVPTRTPYFQAGMRPKHPTVTYPQPLPNGYDLSMHPASASSASSSASSSSTTSLRIPTQVNPRIPVQPRIIQSTPPHRQQFDANTPASRAINHHQQRQNDVLPDGGKCRRVMSYNDQMAHKNQHWEPKKKAASMPPGVVALSLPQDASCVGAVPPILLTYRQRSLSNNGTPTRTRQMLPVPPAPDTSVGDSNPRPSIPWRGSSRARSTSATRVAAALEAVVTTMETSAPLNLPQRTTTTAYTVMDSSNQGFITTPTTQPPRTYTNYSRKAHSYTPEELGLAVRSGSAQFQEDGQHGEGPTVKTFLMNLNQQLK